ncbi:MAG TPA: glycosyltransferase family 87 protein [Solirubrobacteraceae bacterium]|nr:glycosyltransferase family 87 protein [Solirubrobacteraceae bacterium]
MREDPGTSEPAVALASSAVPVAGAEASVTLPRVALAGEPAGASSRITLGPVAGRVAVGTLILATFVIVAAASSGPSILVSRSVQLFPNWEAGPLHVIPRLITNPDTVGLIFSCLLVVMLVAYAAALAAVRSLSMRMIAVAVVALHLILLLSPPMQLTDLFNYVGYARLGALHHLNPYTHVIRQELFDPVYGFSSWHNLRSPYGPLFLALTYPLALVSLPIAYWAIKLATVALSLAFVALIWQIARQLGRDPRFPVAFVALNPVFLIYAVEGFHNDFFMLVPMLGAISLALAHRDRAAGGVLMLAVAVKFTAILLLPFLLVAAHTRARRKQVLVGAAVSAVPLIALDLALFGFTFPNLSQQSTLLTDFSFPNLFGLILGVGGTPFLLKLAAVGVVLVVAYQYFRNSDWIAGAGWSTLALIASLSWLMPWYIVWLLPLAALATSIRLRRVAVALTVYAILVFVPTVNTYMNDHGINLLNTPAGRASTSLQYKLGK